MAEAQKKTNLDYVNEIWNIADYVWDVISRADYNKVVLPFALLRRLECALEPTRAAVCDAVKEHERTGDVNLITIASIPARHFIMSPRSD